MEKSGSGEDRNQLLESKASTLKVLQHDYPNFMVMSTISESLQG